MGMDHRLSGWSDEALRSELADREAERIKREEAKAKPEPIPSNSGRFLRLLNLCNNYIAHLEKGNFDHGTDLEWRSWICMEAIECIFGKDVSERVKSKQK